MTVLLYEGKNRANSEEITISSDQVLNLNLTSDIELTSEIPVLVVQRKNSKNEFKPFSLNDGGFAGLGFGSESLSIPLPGTYRIVRPDLSNFTPNVGVEYEVSYGEIDFDQPLSLARSNKDENSIFTTLTYTRSDSTVAKISQLSGGSSPEYTTRTETWYAADGETIVNTLVYALTYDTGELVSEELQ
jgi:hypothetical protein